MKYLLLRKVRAIMSGILSYKFNYLRYTYIYVEIGNHLRLRERKLYRHEVVSQLCNIRPCYLDSLSIRI
jgi:hypothetical protein